MRQINQLEASTAANLRTRSIVGSALWAAAGDALGWISELTDEGGLLHRTGSRQITAPVNWKRRIGGRFGPTVDLPAGTYSDDTQLRLAVCRATRGSGEFDVEAFAKVELTVWPAYSLGAGLGTAAAAANLAKANVAWFSNFFGSRGHRGYFLSGGNGAAMRVQPHVWKQPDQSSQLHLVDVLRDALTTHGHPQGFCGAVFHALCLQYAIANQAIPGPEEWINFLVQLEQIPTVVRADRSLSLFWLGAWEENARTSLPRAVGDIIEEYTRVLATVDRHFDAEREIAYDNLLKALGAFERERRGGGMVTAIAAVALSWICRSETNERALKIAANCLASDTDTIATMAGAILGAVRQDPPHWPMQDREYIEMEANRMASIANGARVDTFAYPDLLVWRPPTNQSEVVGFNDEHLVVAGLGRALPYGQTWTTKEASWQWIRLDFGQTLLAKRKLSPHRITKQQIPVLSSTLQNAERTKVSRSDTHQPTPPQQPLLPLSSTNASIGHRSGHAVSPSSMPFSGDIDSLTDWVIQNDFEPYLVGLAFLKLLDGGRPIENAAGFAAILAKAILARKKKLGPKKL